MTDALSATENARDIALDHARRVTKQRDELREVLRRALDEHMAEKRFEVELTGEPAEGGAGCWCHDAQTLLGRQP